MSDSEDRAAFIRASVGNMKRVALQSGISLEEFTSGLVKSALADREAYLLEEDNDPQIEALE
jgi:hypothetical protein